MLAPLSRMTLTVVAALLISFVDGSFESSSRAAERGESPTMLLSYEDNEVGADSLQLRAQVRSPGLTCTLRIVYEDGAAEVLQDVKAGPDGICASVFALSDRPSSTGMAEVQLEVTNDFGTVEGEATQAFAIVR